jgi:hypothetical protein
VAKTEARIPIPQPTSPSFAPELRTSRITLARCDPSASRMAISRVRNAAEKAITL